MECGVFLSKFVHAFVTMSGNPSAKRAIGIGVVFVALPFVDLPAACELVDNPLLERWRHFRRYFWFFVMRDERFQQSGSDIHDSALDVFVVFVVCMARHALQMRGEGLMRRVVA